MPTPSDSRISIRDEPTVLDIAAGSGVDGQLLDQGQRIGPYRIERLLGMGGMGAVYLAEQVEPIERQVALKLIRGQLRGGLAEAYFLVERQALARMDHPAIAKVFDAGTTPQGHLFFAMEWIDGETLTAYCENHALPLRERLALFMRVCMGVQHAHQKGVIHRDLKPGNVLVAQVDGQPMPKIIDFGVATGTGPAGHGSTSVAQSVGTRGYMSPEQSRGVPGEVDIRSDVFALGIMLLELIAPPDVLKLAAIAGLDNASLHSALLASLGRSRNADAEASRGLGAIPEELRWLVVRATDPARTGRYDSAQKLADDIDSYLHDYPLESVPSTRSYRLRCFVSRNRGTMLAATVVALALIAGTTAAVIGMLQARAAAEQARIEAIKSQQATSFLSDVLTGIDPAQARDMDKSLLNLVLERADKRASGELLNQPEILATIEDTIGVTYNGLGEYTKAIEHSRRAYAAARSSLGEDALGTLKIQRNLARPLENAGQLKEVNAMLSRNTALLQRTRGPNDPETLSSQLRLVENITDMGHFDEAESKLAPILPEIKRIGEKDVGLAVEGLDDQATLLTYMGRYEQAEPIFRDAIARETSKWGADDPHTLDTENEFSIMYGESHHHAESAAILEKILPIEEKLYGPDSAVTLTVVGNLAGALRQQETPQKIAESGPYYVRAYEGMRKKFGDKHPDTIMATGNYGNYLLEVGKVEQAVAMEQTALKGALEVFGPNDDVTGETEFQLGKALLAARRYEEAEKPLLAAIAERQKDLGADHWRIGGYIDPLIEDYKAWGKPDLATQWQAKRAALKPKPAGES
ncbi:MAG TPA: serine/threonine-protein kinase [Xanthomonadaceae bacterium]|nr:serine/threonine-protein kinase [Xanthomonadaceae bacterium]